MRKHLPKDIKRRSFFHKLETRRIMLKAMIRDSKISPQVRMRCIVKLAQLRNSSLVRIRNRCSFTGRSRGLLRRFRMSRITLRQFIAQGLISGIFKSSW